MDDSPNNPQPERASLDNAATQNPEHTYAPVNLMWYYKMQRARFMPIKPPSGWCRAMDVERYTETFGESDDYRRDTMNLMEGNLEELHRVLEAGIHYFSRTNAAHFLMPISALTLREKIVRFTELLPASANENYTLRFTLNLAWILWLDSERERLLKYPSTPWLFAFYELADSLLAVALELKESLQCEHEDYKTWSQS